MKKKKRMTMFVCENLTFKYILFREKSMMKK